MSDMGACRPRLAGLRDWYPLAEPCGAWPNWDPRSYWSQRILRQGRRGRHRAACQASAASRRRRFYVVIPAKAGIQTTAIRWGCEVLGLSAGIPGAKRRKSVSSRAVHDLFVPLPDREG